jgi:hypothetical protein
LNADNWDQREAERNGSKLPLTPVVNVAARNFRRYTLTWSSTTSVVVSTSESTDNSNRTFENSRSENVADVPKSLIGCVRVTVAFLFTLTYLPSVCARPERETLRITLSKVLGYSLALGA